jgi:glycerol-3-phosphate dehydrogenase (NAD(P)+)
VLARKGTKVTIWARESEVVESVNSRNENELFLAKVKLSSNITATNDLNESLKGAQLVLLVIPTPFLRSVIVANRTALPLNVPLVCCSKGIENDTLMCPYEILIEELPGKYHHSLAVLSGPSFAKETAEGQPTSVLLACPDKTLAQQIQMMMSDVWFRVYTNDDMVGAELCGAIKNVVAIACGAAYGYGFGSNTSALLISRGLMEMTRLVMKKGGKEETMMGLAGVGDLVLTCSSHQSRNFTVGMRIAKGETLKDILATHTVAEGVKTSESVHLLAKKLGVEMPICEQVYQVLFSNKPFMDALSELQHRPLGPEFTL